MSSMGYIPTVSSSYEPPSAGTYEAPSSGGYEPPSSGGYEPPSSGGYEPPTSGGYEPPSSGGYEPPSYEPASMNDEPDSPIDTRPKKKSFMDDDDEPVPATAVDNNIAETPKVEKSKAEKDREADEEFRKAAEADGKLIHNDSFTILTRFQPRKTLLRRPQRRGGVWAAGSRKKTQQSTVHNQTSQSELSWERKVASYTIPS